MSVAGVHASHPPAPAGQSREPDTEHLDLPEMGRDLKAEQCRPDTEGDRCTDSAWIPRVQEVEAGGPVFRLA